MPTNASGGLVTALKSSLADSNDGWSVVQVIDTSAQSSYVTDADERIFLTYDTRSVTMKAAALTIDVDSSSPMVLTYLSIWSNGVFYEGRIVANGGEWRTTDSALDTTVRALAATHLSTRDTRLTAALNASASTVDVIPSDVLTAIKASLADTAMEWEVRHVVIVPQTTPGAIGGVSDYLEVSTTLVSSVARIPAGTSLPAQIGYVARLDTKRVLIESRVMISGATWRTRDSALHTTIMTMAAAFQTEQQAAIVAGLEA